MPEGGGEAPDGPGDHGLIELSACGEELPEVFGVEREVGRIVSTAAGEELLKAAPVREELHGLPEGRGGVEGLKPRELRHDALLEKDAVSVLPEELLQ